MLHLSRVHVRYPVQVLYRTITSQWSGLASDDDGDMAAVSTLVFAELQESNSQKIPPERIELSIS